MKAKHFKISYFFIGFLLLGSCAKELDIGESDIPVSDLVIAGLDPTANGVSLLQATTCNLSSLPLDAFVLPSDSADQRIVWSSSNIEKLIVTSEHVKNPDGSQKTIGKLCWNASASSIPVGTQVAVTATSADNPKKKRTVTINAAVAVVPVETVTVMPSPSKLRKGFKKSFSYTLGPIGNNTIRTETIWSVEQDSSATEHGSATIGSNGELTAVSAGSVLVRMTVKQDCTKPGTPATCKPMVWGDAKLEVTPLPLMEDIHLTPTDVVLGPGGVQTIYSTFSPSDTDIDKRKLVWTSSDSDITITHATGDTNHKEGILTATSSIPVKKVVTVTVKAESPKPSSAAATGKTIKVTLLPTIVPVSNLSCTAFNEHILAKGESLSLDTELTPSNASAIVAAAPASPLKWTVFVNSPDVSTATPVVSVNANGKVTAENAGLAVVQAEVPVTPGSTATKSCTHSIEVKSTITPVTDITLDKATLLFTSVGTNQKITSTLSPPAPTNPKVLWVSDNPSVATVDQTGNVTSTGLGEATIKAFALGGANIVKSVTVRSFVFNQPTTDANNPKITTDFVRLYTQTGGTSFTFPNGYGGSYNLNQDFVMGKTELTYLIYAAIYDWATTDVGGGKREDGGPVYKIKSKGGKGASGAGETGDNPNSSGDPLWQPATAINYYDVMAWLNALTEWYNTKILNKPTFDGAGNFAGSGALRPVYYNPGTGRTSGDVFRSSVTIPPPPPPPSPQPVKENTANGFRLPTHEEWYFAATWIGSAKRTIPAGLPNAGALQTNTVQSGSHYYTNGNSASGAFGLVYSPTATYITNDPYTFDVAWVNGNRGDASPSIPSTSDVAKKRANPFGCYDMSGNVWELIEGSVNRGGGIGDRYWEKEGSRQVKFYKGMNKDQTNFEVGLRWVRSMP